MLLNYASTCNDIHIVHIDSAPYLKNIHTRTLARRIISGGALAFNNIFKVFLSVLFRQVDVIHITSSGSLGCLRDCAIVLIANYFGIPFYYHLRFGRVPEIAKNKTIEWKWLLYTMSRSTAVVAIDKATVGAINFNAPRVKTQLIPNFFDFYLHTLKSEVNSEDLDVNKNKKIALFVGAVIATKGINELINAWVKSDTNGWTLQIVGSSNSTYIETVHNSISSSLSDIQFLGELSHKEVIIRFSLCDVFILPSYTEGFPNVVLEAMALGKAVIASSVGAIPEMLGQDCGYLIEPRNEIALSKALNKVCTEPQLRQAMGARAKLRAYEKYSVEKVFPVYLSLWREGSRGSGF